MKMLGGLWPLCSFLGRVWRPRKSQSRSADRYRDGPGRESHGGRGGSPVCHCHPIARGCERVVVGVLRVSSRAFGTRAETRLRKGSLNQGI